jgi:ABC-2 type transport system ATP-binding protein
MREEILHVARLEKYYGSFHALKGIDLSIKKGEIFGLLGPNGAGKTTMLRVLVGLIKPTSGEVRFFDKLGLNDLIDVLPRIGCIIEEPRFYPYLSGRKNLEVAGRYYPETISSGRISELIELVGLAGRDSDKVKTYSQGMRQRLGIAQAMLNNPEIVILDEPTNGLDPKGIIELRQLIIRLKEEFGKTIILSSHILSEVEQMADSMAIINNGVCVSQGLVSELLAKNVVSVSMETETPDATLVMLHALGLKANENRGALIFQADLDSIPLIVEKLTAAGQRIFRLDHRRKLEDYFLKLTAS